MKNRRGMIERSNSNSFEFNSNGFELGLGFISVQNVVNLGGAPENEERIYGKVRGQEL